MVIVLFLIVSLLIIAAVFTKKPKNDFIEKEQYNDKEEIQDEKKELKPIKNDDNFSKEQEKFQSNYKERQAEQKKDFFEIQRDQIFSKGDDE